MKEWEVSQVVCSQSANLDSEEDKVRTDKPQHREGRSRNTKGESANTIMREIQASRKHGRLGTRLLGRYKDDAVGTGRTFVSGDSDLQDRVQQGYDVIISTSISILILSYHSTLLRRRMNWQ